MIFGKGNIYVKKESKSERAQMIFGQKPELVVLILDDKVWRLNKEEDVGKKS